MESQERIKQPIAERWMGNIVITVLNLGESGAATDEAAVMAAEEQAPVDFDNKSKDTKFHRFEYD